MMKGSVMKVSKSQPHGVEPLAAMKAISKTIDHRHQPESMQYEFYIPAAIWKHSAVKVFVDKLRNLDRGATIFKGVLGIWKDEQEDTYIYRLILGPEEATDDYFNRIHETLCEGIAEMKVKLSEWKESAQDDFLFTETKLSVIHNI